MSIEFTEAEKVLMLNALNHWIKSQPNAIQAGADVLPIAAKLTAKPQPEAKPDGNADG